VLSETFDRHMTEPTQISAYRGSPKHKNRPARGRKGTRCPEWTHVTISDGYKGDPFAHDWDQTEAHELFKISEFDPGGSGKRYATARGIAFVGQSSADGTWHGYPEPWNRIPAALKDRWLAEKKMTVRDLKRYSDFPKDNISWALEVDDE